MLQTITDQLPYKDRYMHNHFISFHPCNRFRDCCFDTIIKHSGDFDTYMYMKYICVRYICLNMNGQLSIGTSGFIFGFSSVGMTCVQVIEMRFCHITTQHGQLSMEI